jgi:hypothetical protein
VKLGIAISELAEAEARLAAELERAGERHKADHDVHHLSSTLANISRAHLEKLEPFGERYDAKVEPPGDGSADGGVLGTLREKASELSGRREEASLLLLRDLRRLFLMASETSLGWTVLGQAAQAARDEELLACVSDCHPDTLRQLKWVTTRLKQAAPQALTG